MHGVFFESHGAGVALEVNNLFWGGSHGLKLHATAMTLSNECPMCETNVLQLTEGM